VLEISLTTRDSCENVINVKETPQEINQILKSIHEDRHMGLMHHVFFILSLLMFPIISPKSM